MKKFFIIILAIIAIVLCILVVLHTTNHTDEENNMIDINIKVGRSNFSAKLYDNKSTKQFIENFPVTYNMSELNGNEKYYYMQDSLPTDSKKPGIINKGDIMLYGSDCLVVFYKTFPTSYSYTKLGYIEDPNDLEKAVGKEMLRSDLNLNKKLNYPSAHTKTEGLLFLFQKTAMHLQQLHSRLTGLFR